MFNRFVKLPEGIRAKAELVVVPVPLLQLQRSPDTSAFGHVGWPAVAQLSMVGAQGNGGGAGDVLQIFISNYSNI